MARRRRAAGQGSRWRESQPAPPLICCFASRLSHLLFLLRGGALRCLARKGRRQRTVTGREEPSRAANSRWSEDEPMRSGRDDVLRNGKVLDPTAVHADGRHD